MGGHSCPPYLTVSLSSCPFSTSVSLLTIEALQTTGLWLEASHSVVSLLPLARNTDNCCAQSWHTKAFFGGVKDSNSWFLGGVCSCLRRVLAHGFSVQRTRFSARSLICCFCVQCYWPSWFHPLPQFVSPPLLIVWIMIVINEHWPCERIRLVSRGLLNGIRIPWFNSTLPFRWRSEKQKQVNTYTRTFGWKEGNRGAGREGRKEAIERASFQSFGLFTVPLFVLFRIQFHLIVFCTWCYCRLLWCTN